MSHLKIDTAAMTFVETAKPQLLLTLAEAPDGLLGMLQLEAATFLELRCRARNRLSGAEQSAVQNRLPPASIPGIIKQDIHWWTRLVLIAYL